MQNKVLAQAIFLTLLMGSSAAHAADADSFRTTEYQAMGTNVLDTIHAAEAYAKGYTGAGVTVGVIDQPINFSSVEFSGKANSFMVDVVGDGAYNWEQLDHGTHVAGIVAAAKNGVGMHGVAYDAEVIGANLGSDYAINPADPPASQTMFAYYLQHPEIKIINCSWATDYYLNSYTSVDSFFTDALAKNFGLVAQLLQQAKTSDKLLVMAAGNSGHVDTSPEGLSFYKYSSGQNNIINVTAADAYYWTANSSGGYDVNSNGVAYFSDLALFTEDWSVMAPGVAINSANANYAAAGDIDVPMNGTSMATPMVSGVGALVQQAYPYLTAKQIGDVLLSTANNKITATDDGFLSIQQDGTGDNAQTTVNIYVMNTVSDSDINTVVEKILSAYSLPEAIASNCNVYTKVPVDAIFGQGMVDASKAVNGLGAINVRRLTSSDISDKYTVSGSTEKQALYSVDTQGYNSVWSNDISEIRAGKIAEQPLEGFDANSSAYSDVKDLYERYVYYNTTSNWGQSTDSSSSRVAASVVQEMQDIYNQYYEEQGLIGLHAGLCKTGEGILVLSGDNTYKGSTIAAGGTLQIDGSVAGDAYSEGEGTIAGIGEIKGNLYNNGTVMAGQAMAVSYEEGDTAQSDTSLTVNGGMSGNGTITINIFNDGTTQTANVINVAGKTAETDAYGADISAMSLQAGTSAAPDATVTFLTATKGVTINESFTNDEAYTEAFSGLLNARVSVEASEDGTGQVAKITTSASNNTGVQEATFTAVNGLYNSLTSSEQQEMYTLYALDKENATIALNQLNGTLAQDMAHDALQNRDVRTALREQEHLQRDEGLWMLLDKHWQRYDNTDGHGFTTTIGKDFFNNDSAYAGALFAYSTNTLSDKYDSGDYDNYTLGIYGGTKNAPGTWRGYISYGLQDNSVNRNLSSLGRSARADYGSTTLGAGVRYAYDLQYGNEAKVNHWHAVPYAQLNYTHYKQDGYTEKGAGVYERQVAGYSDNYADGELGLELKRTDAYGSYGFSVGYRRILTGEQQTSTAFFTGDGNRTAFTSAGTAEEKDHVVVGAFIGTQFSDKWSAAGQLQQDWSSNSNELHVNVVVNYSF